MIQPASQPDAILNWMDSLADPTRLRLLRLIERQELGVAELCDALQLPQSTVSRHLKILADQGWTVNRRHGTANLYAMPIDEIDPSARRLWLLAREQTEGWATSQQDQLRLTRRLRQRQDEAEKFFAGAAAEWDRLREELYGHRFAHAALLALLPADWVIADLGCGTAALTAELAGCVRQVIGVDQSPAMLKAARRRTAGMENVELRRGTLEAIPIADNSCDAALLVLVLTYVEHPAQVLKEAARILRPGGRLVVADLMRHDREDFRRQMGQASLGFAPEELTAALTEAGLAKPTVRSLPPEPNVKGPALLLASTTKNPSPQHPNLAKPA